MDKFHIGKIEFNLNLSRTYHLYQINDSHVVYTNNKKEQRWFQTKDYFAKKYHEEYDEYFKHASSINITREIIDYVNNDTCDLVVLNGDIIDYECKSNEKVLSRLIKRIKTRSLFINGNHDKKISNESFQVIEYDDLLIIGIDNANKCFSSYQVERLKKELKKEKDIIIFFHIPLKTSFNETEMEKYDSYFYIDDELCDKDSKEFIRLLLNNNRIKGVLCGHLHGSSTSYLKEGLPQYVSSSALIGYFSEIIIN